MDSSKEKKPRQNDKETKYLDLTSEDDDLTRKWSLGNYTLLLKVSLICYVNFTSFSLLFTFFPIEAARHGASKLEIGLIFGISSMVAFPASLFYGVLIPRVGAQRLLMCGIFTTGTSVILFGFVNLISLRGLFVAVCLILRALAAAGSAATVTTIRAVVMTKYGDSVGFSMGVIATAVQLGFTTGAVIGGALYTFGGFKLPFLVVGSILLLLLLLVMSCIPKDDVKASQTDIKLLCKAFSVPGVSIIALTIAVLVADLSVIDPMLAPHVNQIDPTISAGVIGLIFLLNTCVVAVLSPFSGWISDRTGCNEVLLISGLIVGGISLEMIGPAPFLTSILPTKKLWLVCVAMATNATGAALTLPPSIKVMRKYARNSGMPDNLTTNGIISGIYTAASKLGSFSGPVFGGMVVQLIDFNWCASIFGIVSLAQAFFVAVFIFFWRASVQQREKSNYQELGRSNEGK